MHPHWSPTDRHRWESLHEQALGSLQQSWAYGQALASLHVPILRAALTEANPQPQGKHAQVQALAPWRGLAQFIVHRLPWFVRFAYAQGGPVWTPGTLIEAQTEGLEALSETLPLARPRFGLYAPPVEIGARAAAPTPNPFQHRPRLATGASTVLLDLTQDEGTLRAAQEGRWRNRLNAAERSPLKVRVCGSKSSDIQWLIDAEAQQRRARRYLTLPTGFVAAYQAAHRRPSQSLLTLAAEHKNQRCAGMMFLLHGRSATYHLGWTDNTGRELSAHNLLLWQGCRLLAERGIAQLDLGGVDTDRSPGLARFKIGSGGRVVTWAGTYL